MKIHNTTLAMLLVPLTMLVGNAVATCGWLGDTCCPSSDSSSGKCVEDGTTCRQGICLPCGHAGFFACEGGKTACDSGLFNKIGFCVAEEFSADPESQVCGGFSQKCCDLGLADKIGGLCLERNSVCVNGTCARCGIKGSPSCTTAKVCADGSKPIGNGWCLFKSLSKKPSTPGTSSTSTDFEVVSKDSSTPAGPPPSSSSRAIGSSQRDTTTSGSAPGASRTSVKESVTVKSSSPPVGDTGSDSAPPPAPSVTADTDADTDVDSDSATATATDSSTSRDTSAVVKQSSNSKTGKFNKGKYFQSLDF